MLEELSYFDEVGNIVRKVTSNIHHTSRSTKIVLFTYDKRLDDDLFLIIFKRTLKKFSIANIKTNDYATAIEFVSCIDNHDTSSMILISKNEPYLYLICRENRNVFNILLKEFNKLYPFMSRIYLRSREIKNVLTSIQSQDGATIVVKESILKRYYGDREVQRSWVDISDYNEVFQKAKQEYIWVDGLRVSISLKSVDGTFRINRKGVIQYENGIDFLAVKQIILDKIIISKNKILIDQTPKARDFNNLDVKSYLFKLSEDAFTTSDDAQNLILRINKSLKTWGYSSILSEDGFLWLLLHDYASGSSYEIMITTNSEIAIMPQTQASLVSFNELIGFLVRNYDGEVICE